MWPRHCSNKASHNSRTPGTLDGWIAWNGGWGWRRGLMLRGWGPGGHRRKGLDCTGYITRHSRLSPMRFNARSRTLLCDIPCKSVVRFVSLVPSFSPTRFYSTVTFRTSSWLSMLDPFVVLARFHLIRRFFSFVCSFFLSFLPFFHIFWLCFFFSALVALQFAQTSFRERTQHGVERVV